IQGVGLTGTSRARDEQHAIRPQDVALEFLQRLWLETQLGHVQPQVLFIEQAEHDLFAVQRRHRGNAEVQLLLPAVRAVLDHDAAVLRQAFFRDVQFGHDLYAAGHWVFQAQRRAHYRFPPALPADAHAHLFLVNLEVNIAGAALYGIGPNQIDPLDHW